MSRPPCCSHLEHEALKSDREHYLLGTYYLGMQEYGGTKPLELRNCKICDSTLAILDEIDDEISDSWERREVQHAS